MTPTILGPESFDPSWRRIMVMGPSGAGKTTLALELGRALDIEVVHLDRFYWMPGWVSRPFESFLPLVEDAAAQERWIIEGNYRPTLEPRLARGDVLIYLDLTRNVFFPRAMKRTLRSLGRERDDLGPGKPDRFEWSYVRWLWNHDRNERAGRAEEMRRNAERVPVVWLRTTDDVRQFRANISARMGEEERT